MVTATLWPRSGGSTRTPTHSLSVQGASPQSRTMNITPLPWCTGRIMWHSTSRHLLLTLFLSWVSTGDMWHVEYSCYQCEYHRHCDIIIIIITLHILVLLYIRVDITLPPSHVYTPHTHTRSPTHTLHTHSTHTHTPHPHTHTHTDPTTQRGRALLVLCEQELLAFDLEAPKYDMSL